MCVCALRFEMGMGRCLTPITVVTQGMVGIYLLGTLVAGGRQFSKGKEGKRERSRNP